MESSRRLAAIMFTDIVGYTALMGENEEAALNLLAKNRTIHKSIIAQYQGEWLKEMGDGTLASFNTSTDAVICGAAIQSEAKKDGITLRIGIHIGEVVFEDHDVFGDGVNISSRIESIAPPDGIWVSESVHKNVHNKKGIETTFVKVAHLKNVIEPVNIYEAKVEGIEALPFPAKPGAYGKTHLRKILAVIAGLLAILALGYFGGSYFTSSAKSKEQIFEKSIAVLPFKSLSEDPEKQYLADGVMDVILLHLSKIEDLRVVTRTSVEKYRDPTQTIPEIARELQVNYILEGSFQKYGDQARLIVQLSNAEEKEDHIWASEYNNDWSDIFSVQSEVALTIAAELYAAITPQTKEIIETIPTKDITAYDYYLQGKEYFNNFLISEQESDLVNAEILYNAALELDPDFGLTYAGLARIHWERNQYNFYKEETSVDTVLQLCNKAIALDANAADAYWIRGSFYDHFLFEIEKAEKDLKKAIEINPSHLDAKRDLAFLVAFHKRDYASAFKLLREAENIDKSPGQLSQTYSRNKWIYQSIGYWVKFIEYHNKQKEVNPLVTDSDLIWTNWDQGKFREAQDIAKSQLDTNSILYALVMGWTHLYLKEYNQAVTYFEIWETFVKEHPDHWSAQDNWFNYGMALTGIGNEKIGIQMMKDQLKKNDEMMKNFQRMDQILYNSAAICAFLGEKERAYDYLRRFDGSLIRWDSLIYRVQFDPMFDNLREDEEFKSIINEVQGEHKRIREELARVEARGEL